MRGVCVCLALSWFGILAGCSSYYPGFVYEPRPVDVVIKADELVSGEIRSFATINGMRRADDELGLPQSIEARLRVDNLTDATVSVDPASLLLTDAGVNRFERPLTEPQQVLRVPPAESAVMEAWFPVPRAGAFEADGLNLRWVVTDGSGRTYPQSATFTRRVYEHHRHYYHHGYGYPYHRHGFHFGYSRWWCY